MQPKSQRNIESSKHSEVAASFYDLYFEKLRPSLRTNELSSIAWLFQQVLAKKSLQQETTKQIDEQTIDNLTIEVRELRNDLKRHSDLLKISNDLLLELNTNIKTQEAQSYFWTDSWIEAEREADEDIKNNNVYTFESANQIIEFLRQS